MKIEFESCVFDSGTREVLRSSSPLAISPKAFALLSILIGRRPEAVSRATIHAELWPGTFVSETNLANLVLELRESLGDDARKPRIIRTVRRFGYAFCAETRPVHHRTTEGSEDGAIAYRLIWGRREIALDAGDNLIGRDRDAVVWIDHESVSRHHARVRIDKSGACIEDLGSKNGTYVEAIRIRAAKFLEDRDVVRIGPATLVLRVLRRTGSTLSAMKNRASR